MTHRTPLFEPAILRASIPTATGTTMYDAIGWRPSLDLERILADVVEHHRTAPAEFEEPAPADVA